MKEGKVLEVLKEEQAFQESHVNAAEKNSCALKSCRMTQLLTVNRKNLLVLYYEIIFFFSALEVIFLILKDKM